MAETIGVEQWFDVKNQEHLEAFYHLSKEGTWPEGFIDKDVVNFSNTVWQQIIAWKLAMAYIEEKVGKI
jgi:hypothetical protein